MRILFLTQVLPFPLDAGPKIRAYYVLKHLARRGHEITLVSFVREDDDEDKKRQLYSFCRNVHTVPISRSHVGDVWNWLKSTFSGQPFLIVRDQFPEMFRLVESLLGKTPGFDAIHSDQLWMASYGSLGRKAGTRPLLVLDQHNAVFQIPKRLAESETNPVKRTLLLREARKLSAYECHACNQFDRVVWVTHNDCEAVRTASSNRLLDRGFEVIPICVDPDEKRKAINSHGVRRVTFVGGMHWPPNAQGIKWFVSDVWPKVRQQVEDCRLTVVGKHPPKKLAQEIGLSGSIEVVGYVPSLDTYLSETAVFIVPLFAGGGMRVKILEAWNWGLPVVSTTMGAEGLDAVNGENLILADSSEAFAAAVTEVLRNPDLSVSLSGRGRATLENSYDWRKIYSAWDRIYP